MTEPMPSRVSAQPLLAVRDVAASSAWYQAVLGLRSLHGGDEYEQVGDDAGFVLQLHDWFADEHEHLGTQGDPSRGNGVLVWFSVVGFDDALARIRDVDATVIEGPLVNPNARHREVWLRDPDGYAVVVAGQYGDLGDGGELGTNG